MVKYALNWSNAWRAWIPSLAVLLIFPLLVKLGFWQLDRAQQKRDMQASIVQRGQLAPLPLREAIVDIHELAHRRVTLSGHYDNAHIVLLDNKIHKGRVGYHVLVPLHLNEVNVAVLVNRGWIPMGTSRAQLPDVPILVDQVQVRGVIRLLSEKVFTLGETQIQVTKSKPTRVQWLDIKPLSQQFGYTLQNFIVLEDPLASTAFIRDWQSRGMRPEKHTAYAVQWFSLAGVLIMIYLGLTIRNLRQKNLE